MKKIIDKINNLLLRSGSVKIFVETVETQEQAAIGLLVYGKDGQDLITDGGNDAIKGIIEKLMPTESRGMTSDKVIKDNSGIGVRIAINEYSRGNQGMYVIVAVNSNNPETLKLGVDEIVNYWKDNKSSMPSITHLHMYALNKIKNMNI
jgi:hypothetical protein